MVSKGPRRGLLRKIERIKMARAMRPLSHETSDFYLKKIREKWKNIPLNSHKLEKWVYPETDIIRVMLNYNGQLFAVARNLMLSKNTFFYRIFQVNSRNFSLSPIASAEINVRPNFVLLCEVSKNNLAATVKELHPSVIRPRGLDVARPIIEEAIRIAREGGKPMVKLKTNGDKRVEYYKKFGFTIVEKDEHFVTMALTI